MKNLITMTFISSLLLLSACSMRSKPIGSDHDPLEDNFVEGIEGLHGGQEQVAAANIGQFKIHTPRGQGVDSYPEIVGTGDDTYLYFASDRDGSGYNIYRKRPDGSALQMITSDAADELWPRVSPCGCFLAFGSNRLGNWDIYVLDLKNLHRPPMVVTAGSKGDDVHPTWAPEGNALAYASWTSRIDDYVLTIAEFGSMKTEPASYNAAPRYDSLGYTHFAFAELPSGGSATKMEQDIPEMSDGYPMLTSRGPLLTNHGELVTGIHPDFRPVEGERSLVYQDYRKSGVAWNGVRTYDADSGIVTLLQTSDNHGAIQPRWSHDGSRIVYTTVAKSNNPEKASGGDGFGIATPDGRLVFDVRNPTFMNNVSDPVWVSYMGEDRIFFSATKDGAEFIASIKIEK